MEEAARYIDEEPKFEYFRDNNRPIIQTRLDRYREDIENVKKDYDRQKYLWEIDQEEKARFAKWREEKNQKPEKVETIEEKPQEEEPQAQEIQQIEQKPETTPTVADLLTQIQEAQNKIQEAQRQIVETLEIIKTLQTQEPERHETQQVEEIEEPRETEEKPKEEEPAPDLFREYNERIEEQERKGYEALKAFDGLPEKLERLENECFAFGCYVNYNEGILAQNMRDICNNFVRTMNRLGQELLNGEYEKLDESLKIYEARGWRNLLAESVFLNSRLCLSLSQSSNCVDDRRISVTTFVVSRF